MDDAAFDENDALSAMTMRALDLEGENDAARPGEQPAEGSSAASPQLRAVEQLRPFLGGGGPWTAPTDGGSTAASLASPPALPPSESAADASADAERDSRSAAIAEDAKDAEVDEDALYALYAGAPACDPESAWLMMEHAAKSAATQAAAGGRRANEMTFMQRLAFELTDKRRVVPWDSASTDPVLLPLLFKLLADRGLALPELKLQLQAALGYDRTLNTRQLCVWLARHKQHFFLQKVRPSNGGASGPLLLTVWRLSTWQAKHAEAQTTTPAAAKAAAAAAAAAASKPAAAAPPPAPTFQPSPTALPFMPAAHKLPHARAGIVSSRGELVIAVAQLLGMNDPLGLTEPELLRALPHIGQQLRLEASAAGGLFGLCLQSAPATLAIQDGGLQRRLTLRPPSAPAAPAAAAKLSTESGKRLANLAARGISIETEAELIAAVEAAMLAAPPPGLRLSILWERVPPVPPDLREMLGFEQPRGLSKWVKRHSKHWRLINEADGGGCLVPTGTPSGAGGAPLVLGGKKAPADGRPPAASAARTIRELAAELGLSKYASVLESNEVDVPALALLTQDDFRQMGITSIGAQRKLQSAAQAFQTGGRPAPSRYETQPEAQAVRGTYSARGNAQAQQIRQPTPRDYVRPM